MDDDALMAFGAVLAVLSGMFERSRLCTRVEFAKMLGDMAYATELSGPAYKGQANYIGAWAHMLESAAHDPGSDQMEPVH